MRLSPDVSAIIGKTELWRSLRTSCPELARQRGSFAIAIAQHIIGIVRENPLISQEQLTPLLRSFYDSELDQDRITRLKRISAFRGKIDPLVRKEAVSEIIEDLIPDGELMALRQCPRFEVRVRRSGDGR